MSQTVLYEVTSGVAVLRLNRPEKLNAFNAEMLDRCVECLDLADRDDTVRAIVVTGNGKGFCSGGDVDNMGSVTAQTPLDIKQRLQDGVQRIPLRLANIDKPVIAALNGTATGAGLDLALMCDLRFAAESARFAETYSRMALVPGAGGAYFLPRLVGTAKALELLWSAEFVDAAEALRIGLVNRVFTDADLMPRTLEFAARLALAPPLSIGLMKRAVYQSATLDLATSLDLISSHMTVVRGSRDHDEAVAAFREKRTPIFEGR